MILKGARNLLFARVAQNPQQQIPQLALVEPEICRKHAPATLVTLVAARMTMANRIAKTARGVQGAQYHSAHAVVLALSSIRAGAFLPTTALRLDVSQIGAAAHAGTTRLELHPHMRTFPSSTTYDRNHLPICSPWQKQGPGQPYTVESELLMGTTRPPLSLLSSCSSFTAALTVFTY